MKERIWSLCLLLSLLATGLLAQAWSGDQSVALQVHDSKGRAVVDARVVFTFQGVPGETGPDVVATDSKGHAVLAGLSPGPWQIEVSHADFLSYIAMVDVRRGKKPLVSASFLEAGGRSLSPVKVKFSKGDGKAASPTIEARRPSEVPAEIVTETKPPEVPPFQVAETPAEIVAEAPPPEESPFLIAEAPTPTPVPEQVPVVDPTPMATEPIAEPTAEPIAAVPVPHAATEPEVEAQPEPAVEPPAIVAEEIVAEETESPEPEPVEPVAEIPEKAVEVEVPESAPIAQPEVEPAPEPVLEAEVPEVAVEEAAPPEPETAPATTEAIATAAVATPVAESPAPMPEIVPEVERTQPEPEIPSPQPQPSAAPPLPEPAPEPTNEPEMTSMEEVAPETEPAAPPEPPLEEAPAPAAAALAPPGDPGSLVTSHREGTCADCESAEWTLQVSAPAPAVDPTSTGRCGGDVMDVAEQAMQGLATSIQLELEGFIGPIANGTSQEAIRRIEPDLAKPFTGELAEFVGGSSPCQIVGLVLPKEVRFSRVRLGASDQEGVGTCGPGQDCAVGDAQWLGSARVVRGSSATVVWGIFDNRSGDKGRRAFMLAYYRPPNSNWKPRLPAMQ